MVNGQEKKAYQFKKWHVGVTALILTVTLFLYAAIVSLASGIYSESERNRLTASYYRQSNEAIGTIRETTDKLTIKVMQFINDEEHDRDILDDYFYEIHSNKSIRNSLITLENIATLYEIGENFLDFDEYEENLLALEARALALVYKYEGYDLVENEINKIDYEYTSQDNAIPNNQLCSTAIAILVSDEYKNNQKLLVEHLEESGEIVTNITDQILGDAGRNVAVYALIQQILLICLALFDIALFSFVIAVIIIPSLLKNKTLEIEKEHIENTDKLTGALSYNGFIKIASDMLKDKEKDYYIWYGNLLNFKYVNATMGSEIGDGLIKHLYETISGIIKNSQTICRLNDDTFIGISERNEMVSTTFDGISKGVQAYINEYCSYINTDFYVGFYRVKDSKNNKLADMIAKAKIANNKSKFNNSNKKYAIYSQTVLQKQERELEIAASLDNSIKNKDVMIYLQPQYNSKSEIIGCEALCRWNHPKFGFLSPGEFIPILEKDQQIVKLDKYVWEEACRCIKKWNDEKPFGKLIPVSINISRIDIIKTNVINDLNKLVKKYSIDPSLLRIEITESAYVDDNIMMKSLVDKLRANGFIVEMDDFGSGYSSLNMLKEFKLDVIKLDLGFIKDVSLENIESSNIIVSSVIDMAKKLGMVIIAEGVEEK
ncbi:MAG: EAL domain-containing protein, partial [Bacilli bacterium]|nr:EAL domain-containing protein [Bacilli bacterium]